MNRDHKTWVRALHRLFDRERAAILSGDIDALIGLEPEVNTALTHAAPHLQGLAAGDLVPLRQHAERVQDLLDAARRGVRSAQQRVTEIRTACAESHTYDMHGQSQTLHAPRRTLDRQT